ncbi:MAG: DUF420 domain-containing protein [Candidatus Omnitrophota bacterium]
MTVHLPTINASLNALAGIFLFLGWRAIRKGDQAGHKKFMICALITSMVFLVSYITYHALSSGPTRYHGQGILRWIYFFILGTHTPLAALVVPCSIAAVWQAIRGNLTLHTKITKWLLPVWMYVSVTGVIIYLMLYVF